MGTVLGILIGLAGVVGGVLVSQDNELLGVLVLVAGLGLGAAVVFVTQAFELARSVWEWVQLVRSKPDSVRVVSVQPPKGFIIRRDAVVTLDVAAEGARKTIEQTIPIPWLQALIWRAAGKVPTPIGRLTDKRDLNAKVWGRRKDRGRGKDVPPP